ncbi:hypothetical protein CLOM_g14662 [Closterium sp. NIES-68]|nr:hypothetical protein CLOM_g14662 [Closterium sp. NIES-68]GJP81696.1 hypothetical protein CLOP_g11837 [Closterium sp. NIES-67]
MATPFHFQPLPIPSQTPPPPGNGSFWPLIQQQSQAPSSPATEPPSTTPAGPPVSAALPSAPLSTAPHAAGPGSSQALMDALNLLQQNIGALQSLIPLMSQQPPIPTAADQLQQQQDAASVGVASVISQLAMAAANILPQAGLSPPINGLPPAGLTPPINGFSPPVYAGFPQPGNFALSSLPPADNVAPINPYPTSAFASAIQQPLVQPQQQQSPAAVGEPWRPAVPVEQCAAAAPEPKLFGRPLLPQKRKVGELPSYTIEADGGASLAAKKHAAAWSPKETGVVDGAAAIADAGLDEENDEESPLPAGSFDIVEMDPVELLAEHTHFCEICGKGFKRDANLRMHMRGHGDEYKTPEALARPGKNPAEGTGQRQKRFSCPYVGCKRNRVHARFQPLKSVLCVKNHYRRTHCPKMLACSKCGAKRFSVVADLKTHEKHCGRDRWLCSCGTSFSRKDKLAGHLALFKGHHAVTAADTLTDAAITAEAAGAALIEGTGTFSPTRACVASSPLSFPPSLDLSSRGTLPFELGMEGSAAEAGPAVSSQSTNVDAGKRRGRGGSGNHWSSNDGLSSSLNLNCTAAALHEGDTEEREVVLYMQPPSVQLCSGQVINVQKSEERDRGFVL